MRRLLTTLLVLIYGPCFAATNEIPPFRHVLFPYGISLNVPATWTGYSPAMKAKMQLTLRP